MLMLRIALKRRKKEKKTRVALLKCKVWAILYGTAVSFNDFCFCCTLILITLKKLFIPQKNMFAIIR